jgi:methionine synthase II (cobalamin-independent)
MVCQLRDLKRVKMKKLLPTSTAGSLPKPAWLAEPETLWSPWKLQGAELIDGKQDALRVPYKSNNKLALIS